MSLFLIGMRGVGKSAAGRLAAARIGTTFVDVDEAIESRAGMRIAEIFAEAGEPTFRSLEREVCLEILPRPSQLVATGGGCVLDPEIRRTLRRFGQVLWLSAPLAVLRRRLAGSDRPSLTGAGVEEELARVLSDREGLYRELADAHVETGERSLEEVSRVIEHFWSVLPHHDLR
jgi:shikimate kinase